MIAEILLQRLGNKMTASVFPERTSQKSRRYKNLTDSTRRRLEDMLEEYPSTIYIRERQIVVWIKR